MSSVNKEVARCINVIADNIREKAEDVSKDLKGVSTIEIKAVIENGCVLSFDIKKHYTCFDYFGKGDENEQRNVEK